MKDIYMFALLVLFPLAIKYLFKDTVVDTDVLFGFYGKPNNYTVPIIKMIELYNLPTMIVVRKEEVDFYPKTLKDYVKRSSIYKFVPYVKNGRAKSDLDAMSSLINSSIIISDESFSYDNHTVMVPRYYTPFLKNYKNNMTIMRKVWTDVKDENIYGLMLFPYTETTNKMIVEVLHDLIRFKKSINMHWYAL
tara:strand:- start:4107 stop:4682 length:576 start_codon:yes stop_codon:yes gene_type:complete